MARVATRRFAAARPQAIRSPQTYSRSLPAPTSGWVTSKNLGVMKPGEAVVLDNVFPEETDVRLRGGNQVHATDVGVGTVESVMGYSAPMGDKLLAAGGGGIYDCTLAGAATLLQSGFASNRWQAVNFGTAGGSFLLMVNGSDTPQKFDGTAVSANTFTGSGLVPTNLIDINIFKRRVFAVEKNTLAFWYLQDVDTIAGSMARFDLAPLCSLGGYLVSMATWTRDGGNGADDLAVFITSKGEIIIYQGSDPSTASDWSLIGVFRVGAPLGQRCWLKFASDVVILTQDGFMPISRVLALDRTSLAATAISQKIAPTVTQTATQYKDNFGWQGMLYPRGRALLVNVPLGADSNVQFVMNTNTGAWCRYTGLPIICFGQINDRIYFGDRSGQVWLMDEGTSDDSSPISGTIQTSFQYFGDPTSTKKFNLVRPVMQSDGNLSYTYRVLTDFRDGDLTTMISSSGGGTPWDSAPWDSFPWGDSYNTFQEWRTAGVTGRCASLKMNISTAVNQVGMVGVDWIWERGGVMW